MRLLTTLCMCLFVAVSNSQVMNKQSLSEGVFFVPDSLTHYPEFVGLDIINHVEILTDSYDVLSFEDAHKAERSDCFKPLTDVISSFESNKTYWLKLDLVDTSNILQKYFLRLNSKLAFIELYFKSDESKYVMKKAGALVSPKERDFTLEFNHSLLEFSLEKDIVKTLFLKIESGHVFNEFPLEISLYSYESVKKLKNKIDKRSLIFLVVFLCMIVYNFFLLILTKERLYAYYLGFVASVGAFVTSLTYFPMFLSTIRGLFLEVCCINLAFFTFIQFVNSFLEIKKNYPKGYYFLNRLSYVALLFSAPFIYEFVFLVQLGPTGGQDPTLATGVVMVVAIVFVSIKIHQSGNFRSTYFLYSNGIFMITVFISTVVYVFSSRNIINYYEVRYFVFFIIGIGGVSQIMLYAIALGFNIVLLEKEKSMALSGVLEFQENINLQLEEKVTERTAQLEERNKENELLLGEIHHRVKNNLQVISSLLKLQSRQLEEGKAKSAVLEGRDRVKAMALIHQRLYQQDQFSAIQMDDYIGKLVESLAESYGFGEKEFELELNIPEIQLDVDTAVPLGLIINEVVSNSFKHAFTKDNANRLDISLIEKEGKLLLNVSDNGQGIPGDFSIEETSSFGLQLIHALTQELNGTIQFENDQGTRLSIGIKDYQIIEVM